MPSKFIVRNFIPDSVYHIYNKSIESKNLFIDDKDYNFFKIYLFIYTRPIDEISDKLPDVPKRLYSKNLSNEIELAGYSLMPNHFHLILKENKKGGISKLMKQMSNAYTLYYNQKYKKTGPLFNGRFKAVSIPNDLFPSLLRVIHTEPTNFSSFNDYCGQEDMLHCSELIKKQVMSKFANPTKFVEYHQNQIGVTISLDKLKNVLIEIR